MTTGSSSTPSVTALAWLAAAPALLNALPIGMFIYRVEPESTPAAPVLRLMFANQAASAFTGIAIPDMVGRTLAQNFPASVNTELPAAYAEVARSGLARHWPEVDYGDARVSASVFSVHAMPLPDLHVAVAFENVSARWTAEREVTRREDEFRTLAENSPDVIARFSPEGRYMYINPAGAHMLNMPPIAFLGKTFWDLPFHEETRQNWQAQLDRILAGAPEDTLMWESGLDSTARWFQLRAVPEYGSNGQIRSILRVSRDITDRITAERLAAVHQSTLEYAQALEALNEQLQVQGEELEHQREELQVQSEELQVQQGQLEVAYRDIADQADRLSTQNERLTSEHAMALAISGALQSLNEKLQGQSSQLLSQQGQLEAAYSDIAHQAERLQTQNAQLERLARLKDEFLATVSHELRTPLSVIKNVTSILKKRSAGPLNETQERFVAMVQEHITRLTGLVDDILDLQKLESGSFRAKLHSDDVNQTLRSVAESFSQVLADQHLALELELPDAPLMTDYDAGLVGQVMLNLLSNAAKFTPPGGTIRIRAWQDGADMVVAVCDTGIGIPPEDLERIFEKFVQVGDRLSRESGGTGLGLAICRQLIVDSHGGRIWAESTEGHGSTFLFTLPTPAKSAT